MEAMEVIVVCQSKQKAVKLHKNLGREGKERGQSSHFLLFITPDTEQHNSLEMCRLPNSISNDYITCSHMEKDGRLFNIPSSSVCFAVFL